MTIFPISFFFLSGRGFIYSHHIVIASDVYFKNGLMHFKLISPVSIEKIEKKDEGVWGKRILTRRVGNCPKAEET